MSFGYFSKNGEILPLSEATISIQNIQFQYGFGVYESLRVRKGIIYFAKQHLARLLESARIIGLEHPYTSEQLIGFLHEVVQKNEATDCNIKMLLVGGKSIDDALLYILPLAPLFPDRKLYSHGATVETVHYRRFLPKAKTLNMLPSYLSYAKARKNGHYDALLLDDDDTILEGTRTNFFAITGTTLITPPRESVLEGVVRDVVLYLAKKHGFTVKEEKIPYIDLSMFDGAFLTSTSSKIMPLVHIDALRFEIPEKVKELMKHYDAFLDASNGVFPEEK